MDPVNKWLTTVILFMAAFLAVMFYKVGSGRYEMAVQPSTIYENHAVVYVLDTKDGNVHAKLVDEEDLLNYNKNGAGSKAEEVFEIPSSMSYGRKY